MLPYIKNPKDVIRKLLDPIIEFGEVARYKIHEQTSLVFLYNNNKRAEREIKEIIPFTVSTKRITYLGISLPKGLPRWLSSKEPECWHRKHRRHGFNPWDGNIPWKGEWQLTQVFLLEEFHGQRILAGYSPWSPKELDTTEDVCIKEVKELYSENYKMLVKKKKRTQIDKEIHHVFWT